MTQKIYSVLQTLSLFYRIGYVAIHRNGYTLLTFSRLRSSLPTLLGLYEMSHF